MIRRTPLKRTPLKRKRSTPRRGPMRDPSYLAWLRQRWCVACWPGGGPLNGYAAFSGIVDPAHGPVNGRGSKGPDNEAIPLCRSHHEEQTKLGWPAFEQRHGIDRAKEAEIHYSAYLIWKEDGEHGNSSVESR